jgi:uncharacterized Zn-binding protein involved in type VI secretion
MVTGLVPHAGGPIIPKCEPTVLIGSMPAARMGDKSLCVGPVDTILQGEPTVLIGGRPAARMGDSTLHGGVIAAGCPTVLIGGDNSVTLSNANITKAENNNASSALPTTPITPKATPQEIAQRKKLAHDFYVENCPRMTETQIQFHIEGIDFNYPVTIVKVPPDGAGTNGDILYQQTKIDSEGNEIQGRYYTTDNQALPSQLGISQDYDIKDALDKDKNTGIRGTVYQKTIHVSNNNAVVGLKSTTAGIPDTWSIEGESVPTSGGACQIFVPVKIV